MIMTYERFVVLLHKNSGKQDGYTYADVSRAISIPEQTLKNAKSEGTLISFALSGRNPLFAPDAIYAFYKIFTERNNRRMAA
jgi:hypothetical protein